MVRGPGGNGDTTADGSVDHRGSHDHDRSTATAAIQQSDHRTPGHRSTDDRTPRHVTPGHRTTDDRTPRHRTPGHGATGHPAERRGIRLLMPTDR